jgi:hypothetical protein
MATFDYTSRDYLSIRQDLINRAATTVPEWNSIDSSDFANVFVDLWAYMGDILHFYVDRAASETFLATATQRESVIAIANLMDYIPSSVRAARGSINITLNVLPTGATTYVLPAYTVLTGYDDNNNMYSFYTSADSGSLSSGTPTASAIPIVQGTIIFNEETSSRSSGNPAQKYTLLKKNVDSNSITVQVLEGPLSGGIPTLVEYQYVTQLSDANYLDKVFTARITSDGFTEILFGNGFNGFIPTTNAQIFVSYRTADGSAGNIPANKITEISGVPSNYVSISSSTATSGGADMETINSIKNNVTRLYRTNDRAVSLQDYKDLSLQIPGVSKVTAEFGPSSAKTISTSTVNTTHLTVNTSVAHKFIAGQTVTLSGISQSSHNIASIVIDSVPTATSFTVLKSGYSSAPTGSGTGGTATTVDSTVVIYPVPHQSSYPPAPVLDGGVPKVLMDIPNSMSELIESYFTTRSMLGVTTKVTNPVNIASLDKYIQITPVYLNLTINVRENYVQSLVRTQVDNAVRKLLSFDNVYFNQLLTIGEVYRAALSVVGVDYVSIVNMSTTYAPSGGSVANIQADTTKLLCFTDLVSSNPAIIYTMVGGLTGSN